MSLGSSFWIFPTIFYICFAPVHPLYFSTSYGQVGIAFLSKNKFIGSLVSDSGVEVTYESEWDHDYESTRIRSSGNGNLLSSYYVDYPYRLVRAQNTWILHDLNSGHAVEATFLSHLSEQQLPQADREKLFQASRKFFSSSQARSMTSSNPVIDWSSLINQEDLQLLPSLSFGLVELGYSGAHYPILQRLHRLSAQIYPHLTQPIALVSASSGSSFSWCSSDSGCDDGNTPDEDEDCIGLCGPYCKCWCWVCGDCCVHQGCYQHDVCCRNNYYSFNCFLPFNFTCDSYSKQC